MFCSCDFCALHVLLLALSFMLTVTVLLYDGVIWLDWLERTYLK